MKAPVESCLGFLLLSVAINGVKAFLIMPPDNAKVDLYEAQARNILKRVPLVDGHNDLGWHIIKNFKGDLEKVDLKKDTRSQFPVDPEFLAQTDIPRIRQGELGAQMWSAWTPCEFQYKDSITWALSTIDVIKRFVHQYTDTFRFVTAVDDIMPSFRDGKVASMIGLEGGEMIDSNLAVLRMYYDLGVRYMTLTWSCDTPWADSCKDSRYNTPNHHGLTDFGKRVVHEMNRLGMMVDLAHTAVDTMYDAINVSVAPVIFSHSSSYHVCPHERNVPDDVAKHLAANNGIIMINVYPRFINCTTEDRHGDDNRTASVAQVADHYDHFRKLIGSQYLGIGCDFDGSGVNGEMADVSSYPLLFAELLRRGWSEAELENVAYRNFYRVFKQVEAVRDAMRSVPPDSTLLDRSAVPDQTCLSKLPYWP
ncbi:dipeptidase 1-like [Haliotis cracherodii]|uniref:dipeptidase 1-like n=1 Tax=Haliotis cracherodii TaxID=6455 RepID=UPI0039EC11C3